MIPNRKKAHITVFVLTGLLYCTGLFGQSVNLGMTKEDIIRAFGEPDHDVFADDDNPSGQCFLLYGNDYFMLVDDRLESMSVSSKRFILSISQPDYLATVGDSLTLAQESVDNHSDINTPDQDAKSFTYHLGNDNLEISLSVVDNVLNEFSLSKKHKEQSPLNREFKAFFEESYKPSGEAPKSSLWPGRIKVLWNQEKHMNSVDTTSVTFCVPFVSELYVKARYSDKICPQVSRRLVITKFLDKSTFKQSIVSIVPKAGLSPGDAFTGLITYNNVNATSCFAWEAYEEGKLVLSRFPAAKSQAIGSAVNAKSRLDSTLYYIGGPGAISNKDWMSVVANRMDVTKAFSQNFPAGRTERDITAEWSKYTFTSAANQGFQNFNEHDGAGGVENRWSNVLVCLNSKYEVGDSINEKKIELIQPSDSLLVSETSPASGEDDIPAFVGKADNLTRILWPKHSLISLNYESRENPMKDNREEQFLVCTNYDFCNHSLITSHGTCTTVYPGKKVVSFNSSEGYSYYTYRGKAISKVNIKYPYVLPAVPGTKVKFMLDPREKYRSFAVLMPVGTSVCAMRGGQVCITEDKRSVLLCHMDGTFAAYMNVDDVSVLPGDYVQPGEIIGVSGGGKISISIFYLDANKIGSNSALLYTHLTPYVWTENGDVKLETGVEYVSVVNQDIITREMSASAKKKYLKNITK